MEKIVEMPETGSECFLAMVCGIVEEVLAKYEKLPSVHDEPEDAVERWLRMRRAA
jgi:hypothetical protein